MFKPFRSLSKFSSSSKGAKIVLIAWILAVVVFSIFAPSSKEFSKNSMEGSIKENTASEIAKQVLDKEFPTDDGLTALLVFHREEKITKQDKEKITELSQWFASDSKPQHLASALPYHSFPEKVQDKMFSEDGTTLIFNAALKEGIDSNEANETLEAIRNKVKEVGLNDIQFEITGPAGISADTISLFKNADIVLMLATIVLIFIILIIIYRSPLLAITPLIISGIVYGVVDRILGLAGKYEWFSVDSSAVSIMLVLLFAVLTDYSLFVFSRYREELRMHESKYKSMSEAIHHVSEPIFFSGGTVFLAMLTLFTTVFKPYNHFGPVFSLAVVVILLAGLTLIPSIFAIMGRKAFWPFIPKLEPEHKVKKGIWSKISNIVLKRPALFATILLVTLFAGVFNATEMKFSFNLMNSFPEDISSRQGFELLADRYPAGQLAPVTVVLKSSENIEVNEEFLQRVNKFKEELSAQNGISQVNPALTEKIIQGKADLPRNFLSENGKAVKLQIILTKNPYDISSLNTVEMLRDKTDSFLKESQLSKDEFKVHYVGQTAEQVDVKQMNKRDMIILFSLVTVLLTFVIGFQTKSVLLPILMMSTILLSYFATLGFGWLIFKYLLGYEAVSYRLPVYTFVFMVALGIDYNIMLISRIKEKAKELPWKEAVMEGVALTGGVISSAGIILAATFAVLMTQPLQELFLFGFTMAMGILLDTFLIRGILFPSLLLLTRKN
ncbi:MMPL family transporter [Bacillus ndiopicus]|uniref:MMPL family transporter n=1 Tax=Bacillus ndiopicus TaxID=1347368 RepID=UPI0005AAB599|nr:MMPL family transporter [Bacillus ndiopicus]